MEDNHSEGRLEFRGNFGGITPGIRKEFPPIDERAKVGENVGRVRETHQIPSKTFRSGAFYAPYGLDRNEV